MKKIGVIIVNYKNWEDTISCINSIKANKLIDYELEICIVDNSACPKTLNNLKNKLEVSYYKYKDNKFELINEYNHSNIYLVESDKNGGFAYGVNIGIKFLNKKNVDYYLLVNNDTYIPKETLQIFLSKVEKSKKIGLFTLRIYYNDEKDTIWYDGGKFIKPLAKSLHININKRKLPCDYEVKEIDFATFCFVLIPKKIIEYVGLLPEDYFLYFEDLEYSKKVIDKGFKIFHFCYPFIYHKVGSAGGGSFSKTWVYYYYRNYIIFIKRNMRGSFFFYTALTYFFLSKVMSIPIMALKGKQYLKEMLKGIWDGIKYKK